MWPLAFPDRPDDDLRPLPTGADGISRFSCMELPRMRRVFDSAGPMSRLALSPHIVLPSLLVTRGRRPRGVISELNGWPACSPVNACSGPLRAHRHDSGPWRVATAFHIRLFHLPAVGRSSTPCRFIPAHRNVPNFLIFGVARGIAGTPVAAGRRAAGPTPPRRNSSRLGDRGGCPP